MSANTIYSHTNIIQITTRTSTYVVVFKCFCGVSQENDYKKLLPMPEEIKAQMNQ